MTQFNSDRPLEVLTLDLQGEIFALDAGCVREILDFGAVTEVPGAPPFVSGLVNVRGKVVPLADLRVKLGMELKPPTIDTRIVVIEAEISGEPTTVGIRADKVYEVTELAAGALDEAPRIGMTWRPEYIRCIGKREGEFIVVLNLENVFSQDTTDGSSGGRNIAAESTVPVAATRH